MSYRTIEREDVPCWYELSWRKTIPAIALRIHKQRINNLPQNSSKGAHGKLFPQIPQRKFGFTSFEGSLSQDFGFDAALKFAGAQEDFSEFLAPMPKIQRKTNIPCYRCEGSGKEDFSGENCLSCGGSGKKYEFKWQQAYAISASFTILLSQLWLSQEKDTSAPFPQLITVRTATEKGMHGGSLGGMYSQALCKWLRSLKPGTKIPEMIDAMKTAYACMFSEFDSKILLMQFRASVAGEHNLLCVDCPGNACGLHPSEEPLGPEEGCEFSCHNVDTPAQQIVLLAGLAALCDRARRARKETEDLR